jgi:hypothetical protein
MPHLHFSPFQFASAEQVAESPMQVKAQRKHVAKGNAEMKQKTRDMGCTMPVAEAHVVTSSPNAFISPNGADVMRSAHAVFGI